MYNEERKETIRKKDLRFLCFAQISKYLLYAPTYLKSLIVHTNMYFLQKFSDEPLLSVFVSVNNAPLLEMSMLYNF